MPVILYHVEASPPCRSVRMLAKQIGLNMQLKAVDLQTGEQNKPEFLKMNPQHCVPTLDDNGFYLWESRCIMQYIANKYAPDGTIYPKDPQKRAIVDRFLFFDMGTLYKTQADFLYPQMFQGQKPDPDKEKALKVALTYLDSCLEKSPYVAGEHLTIADLALGASLTLAEIAEYNLGSYPHVVAWVKRLKDELPYYDEVNSKGMEEFKNWAQTKKEQQQKNQAYIQHQQLQLARLKMQQRELKQQQEKEQQKVQQEKAQKEAKPTE